MTVVKASSFMTLNDNNARVGSCWKTTSLPERSPNLLCELYKATGCLLGRSSTYSKSGCLQSECTHLMIRNSSLTDTTITCMSIMRAKHRESNKIIRTVILQLLPGYRRKWISRHCVTNNHGRCVGLIGQAMLSMVGCVW